MLFLLHVVFPDTAVLFPLPKELLIITDSAYHRPGSYHKMLSQVIRAPMVEKGGRGNKENKKKKKSREGFLSNLEFLH